MIIFCYFINLPVCSTEEDSEDEEEMKQSQELALKFTESDDYLEVKTG